MRGPQGGHALIRDPHELKLSEAVIALEGSLAPIACLDDPNGCRKPPNCCLRPVWQEIAGRDACGSSTAITIADLAEPRTIRQRRTLRDLRSETMTDTEATRQQSIANSVLDLIGNTPLVRLDASAPRGRGRGPGQDGVAQPRRQRQGPHRPRR